MGVTLYTCTLLGIHSVYPLLGLYQSGARLWMLWRCRGADQLADILQEPSAPAMCIGVVLRL